MKQQYQIGQLVFTPKGWGRVMSYFRASSWAEMTTYVVRLPRSRYGVTFYARELTFLQ